LSPFSDGGFDLADAAQAHHTTMRNGNHVAARNQPAAQGTLDGWSAERAFPEWERRLHEACLQSAAHCGVVSDDVPTNVNAFVTNEGVGTRNQFPNFILRFVAERASQVFRTGMLEHRRHFLTGTIFARRPRAKVELFSGRLLSCKVDR
jgi:hypothetical protein